MKNTMRHVLILTLAAGVFDLATSPLAPKAEAADIAVQNQSFGASYGEWGARWWQWLLSIPAANNPNLDQTGAFCAEGQAGNVWFLAGAFGGTVSRDCTIPPKKALFFPLINQLEYKPSGKDTLNSLRSVNAAFIDSVTSLTCTIKPISETTAYPCASELYQFRAGTPSFTVIAPPKGVLPPGKLTLPANTDSLVADGYWMLLPPLPTGKYTLHYTAATGSFNVDVTYNLTVQ